MYIIPPASSSAAYQSSNEGGVPLTPQQKSELQNEINKLLSELQKSSINPQDVSRLKNDLFQLLNQNPKLEGKVLQQLSAAYSRVCNFINGNGQASDLYAAISFINAAIHQ